jgi:transposase
MDVLWVDVGKREMHAMLLERDRSALKSVPNSTTGFKQLQTWLRNRKVEGLHACLEATGGWSEDLALALPDAGHVVSLVNPRRIKHSRRARCYGQKPTASMQHLSPYSAACMRPTPDAAFS